MAYDVTQLDSRFTTLLGTIAADDATSITLGQAALDLKRLQDDVIQAISENAEQKDALTAEIAEVERTLSAATAVRQSSEAALPAVQASIQVAQQRQAYERAVIALEAIATQKTGKRFEALAEELAQDTQAPIDLRQMAADLKVDVVTDQKRRKERVLDAIRAAQAQLAASDLTALKQQEAQLLETIRTATAQEQDANTRLAPHRITPRSADTADADTADAATPITTPLQTLQADRERLEALLNRDIHPLLTTTLPERQRVISERESTAAAERQRLDDEARQREAQQTADQAAPEQRRNLVHNLEQYKKERSGARWQFKQLFKKLRAFLSTSRFEFIRNKFSVTVNPGTDQAQTVSYKEKYENRLTQRKLADTLLTRLTTETLGSPSEETPGAVSQALLRFINEAKREAGIILPPPAPTEPSPAPTGTAETPTPVLFIKRFRTKVEDMIPAELNQSTVPSVRV